MTAMAARPREQASTCWTCAMRTRAPGLQGSFADRQSSPARARLRLYDSKVWRLLLRISKSFGCSRWRHSSDWRFCIESRCFPCVTHQPHGVERLDRQSLLRHLRTDPRLHTRLTVLANKRRGSASRRPPVEPASCQSTIAAEQLSSEGNAHLAAARSGPRRGSTGSGSIA